MNANTKLETQKFYCEKQRVTKIVIVDTNSYPVQFEVSCRRIKKTIGQKQSGTIVR